MDYRQTLEYLYDSLPDFQNDGASAYKPGLERVEALDRHLGYPDRSFHSVHIAGTNGKGSVSHILAAVLQSAGYRVGLYTSPHLLDFRERIRVDGEMIPEDKVVEFVELHRTRMEEIGLSFFEMTVGMAFDWFVRQKVEVAIVETGLGGRLDATNIVTPLLSVITNIGLDHTSMLGDSVEEIAAEKAGIIKPGVPVVIGESDPQSDPIFNRKAGETGSVIRYAQNIFRVEHSEQLPAGQRFVIERLRDGQTFDLCLDLRGEYQKLNVVTAYAALETLHAKTPLSISRRAALEGCNSAAATTGLQGRWQVLGEKPLVVCDTGHNEHGLRRVVKQIEGQNYRKLFMVLGFVDDKDLGAILPLLPHDAYYLFTQSSNHRALASEKLAAEARAKGLEGEVVPTVKEALKRAREMTSPEDMIFIGGSTYTVAEIF